MATVIFPTIENNAESSLDIGHTDSVTTITLVTGGVAALGLTGTTNAIITIITADGLTSEIVHVTGDSGDTLTGATRGFDGSTPSAFSSADTVEIRIVKSHIQQAYDALTAGTASLNIDALIAGGNVTVVGDLTTNFAFLGDNGASATHNTAALRIDDNTGGAMSIGVPSGATRSIWFAVGSDVNKGQIQYQDATPRFDFSIDDANGSIRFRTGARVEALTLESDQSATFAGDVILAVGKHIFLSGGSAEEEISSSVEGILDVSSRVQTNFYLDTDGNAGASDKLVRWFGGDVQGGSPVEIMNLDASGNIQTGGGATFAGDILLSTNNSNIAFIGSTSAVNSNMIASSNGSFFIQNKYVHADSQIIFQTNGSSTALTLDSSQDATFAGDVLVYKETGNANMTIDTDNGGGSDEANLHFRSGTEHGFIDLSQSSSRFRMATNTAGASIVFSTDTNDTHLTLSGATGSQSATFEGTIECENQLKVNSTTAEDALSIFANHTSNTRIAQFRNLSAGDVAFRLTIPAHSFSYGIDESDDAFKITNATNLSSGDLLSLDWTTGNATFSGSITTSNVTDQPSDFTPIIANSGYYFRCTKVTNLNVTLDSSISFAVGTEMYFEQNDSSGTVTIKTGGSTTLTVNADLTLVSNGQYAVIGVKKVAANTWTVFGNLVPA